MPPRPDVGVRRWHGKGQVQVWKWTSGGSDQRCVSAGRMSERSLKDRRSEASLERAEVAQRPRRESFNGIPRGQLLEASRGGPGSEAGGGGEMLGERLSFP